MTDLSGGGPLLAAPGRERPDYTVFPFPAANLADAGVEEIEIDQAISLQGRRGRELLGALIMNLANGEILPELITLAADTHLQAGFSLASRTGAFFIDDPELLWTYQAGVAMNVTEGSAQAMEELGNLMLGEPELYVAPRLFWRFANNLDRQVDASDLRARISSISQPLNFNEFIELLERFADVTLL